MPPEKGDEERREIIRQLQEQDRRLQAEAKDFEAVIAKRRLDIKGQISRLESPLPAGDICPDCWFTHGKAFLMANHPRSNAKTDGA